MRTAKKSTRNTSRDDVVFVESSHKFKLFLKNREIQQIKHLLGHVVHMNSQERTRWIEQYGEMVNQAFDALVDDSNLVLDDLPLDDEVLQLSHELVTSLRDALHMMEGILEDKPQLVS